MKIAKLKTENNHQFRTIKQICELFEAELKKRGFLYPGSVPHPTKENTTIWWPSIYKRKGWKNSINEDFSEIIEAHENETKHSEHFEKILKNYSEVRYVFLYNKHNDKGRATYKFIGKFELNTIKTNKKQGLVWHRVSNEISIK